MEIRDLLAAEDPLIHQVAALLVEGFGPQAWSTLELAQAEVHSSLAPDHISRVALDEAETVLGWIAGVSQYDGHVWELHPLVVHVTQQGKGIGRALVQDFEERVWERGGLTILLGTDDTDGQTSLAGIDLFPDIWTHLTSLQNRRRHPYEFYQKLGYVVVGVVPDANGLGKPDILMAKSVARLSPD